MLSYSQSPSRIIAIHPFLDFSLSPETGLKRSCTAAGAGRAFVTGHSRQKVGSLAELEKKSCIYVRVRLRAREGSLVH